MQSFHTPSDHFSTGTKLNRFRRVDWFLIVFPVKMSSPVRVVANLNAFSGMLLREANFPSHEGVNILHLCAENLCPTRRLNNELDVPNIRAIDVGDHPPLVKLGVNMLM